ncbi:hypothetical protein [Lonepinella sp. BR2357]|uniref:hypothetical protein n=1 Tax=Lonepinella sp. BR2357 TaxID=3434549 RepID=UPI003F6DF07B
MFNIKNLFIFITTLFIGISQGYAELDVDQLPQPKYDPEHAAISAEVAKPYKDMIKNETKLKVAGHFHYVCKKQINEVGEMVPIWMCESVKTKYGYMGEYRFDLSYVSDTKDKVYRDDIVILLGFKHLMLVNLVHVNKHTIRIEAGSMTEAFELYHANDIIPIFQKYGLDPYNDGECHYEQNPDCAA